MTVLARTPLFVMLRCDAARCRRFVRVPVLGDGKARRPHGWTARETLLGWEHRCPEHSDGYAAPAPGS